MSRQRFVNCVPLLTYPLKGKERTLKLNSKKAAGELANAESETGKIDNI